MPKALLAFGNRDIAQAPSRQNATPHSRRNDYAYYLTISKLRHIIAFDAKRLRHTEK